MSVKLKRDDLENIVVASSFFGGGGGGSMIEGQALIEEMFEEDPNATLEMLDVEEMEECTVATMVAALGSPVATKGKLFEEEGQNAIKGMMDEAKASGKTLKYVYSGEQGGGNTMLPLYAAWKLGLSIIDTDGNGRAVPELNTGLAPIYGVATSPVVLASEKGDTIVGRTEDPTDSKACEKIARYMCQAYDMGIGFSAWMMTKEDLKKATAIGQMTMSMEVGKLLRMVAADGTDLVLSNYFKEKNIEYKKVVEGEIVSIQIDTEGGFDTGVTTIKEEGTGKEYKVLFQNENLVAYDADMNAVATVPSIISLVNVKDGHWVPVSNSETEVGMKVVVTVTAADPRWYNIPEGYDCWKEVLISAGYGSVSPEVRP